MCIYNYDIFIIKVMNISSVPKVCQCHLLISPSHVSDLHQKTTHMLSITIDQFSFFRILGSLAVALSQTFLRFANILSGIIESIDQFGKNWFCFKKSLLILKQGIFSHLFRSSLVSFSNVQFQCTGFVYNLSDVSLSILYNVTVKWFKIFLFMIAYFWNEEIVKFCILILQPATLQNSFVLIIFCRLI